MRLLRSIFLAMITSAGLAVAADAPGDKAGKTDAKGAALTAADAAGGPNQAVIYVIPVREQIAEPILYIVRRGLKEAIEQKADAVVLDMDTPGGAGGVMLEIMEALDKFPGESITYVNREAISAGAIIAAVTDEIYFAPKGIMGSADVVQGTGEDLPEGMKRKVDSYISAKIEVYSQADPRRAEVIKAMRLPDFELKLDEKVIKSKGELLTVTAEKAIALYGDPPTPLLAAGIAEDLDALLQSKFGDRGFRKVELEVTWSEKLARILTLASPVLMGLGLLALFIEFKTPGFGWIGATGIILMLIVFFGHYAAGLSGHEPALLFGIGLLLVVVELLFFPGTAVAAVTGVAFMLISLIWAGADLWPNEPVSIAVSGDVFMRPALNLAIAVVIAGTLFAVALKYLPKTSLYQQLAVQGASLEPAQMAGLAPTEAAVVHSLVGRRGVAVTALYPSGQVEVDGRRYEAKVAVGMLAAGVPVVVVGHSDFGLTVEQAGQA